MQTEEKKLDKRSKEFKKLKAIQAQSQAMTALKETHDDLPMPEPNVTKQYQPPIEYQVLKKFITTGIPVRQVAFRLAVNNSKDMPEKQMSDKSDNWNRRATMWLTSAGLICMQVVDGKEVYFGTPAENCMYWHFK